METKPLAGVPQDTLLYGLREQRSSLLYLAALAWLIAAFWGSGVLGHGAHAVLAGCLVLGAGVSGWVLLSLRGHLDFWSKLGSGLWLSGMGIRSLELVTSSGSGFRLGHVVMGLALVPVLLSIRSSDRQASGGASQKQVIADIFFVASLWLMVTWVVFLRPDDGVPLGHGHWVHLVLIYGYITAIVAMTMVFAIRRELAGFLNVLAMSCYLSAEISGVTESLGRAVDPSSVEQSLLLAVCWASTGYALVCLAQGRMMVKPVADADKSRASWTSGSSLLAMVFLIVSTAEIGTVDPSSLLLLMLLVLTWGGREWARGTYVQEIVTGLKRVARVDSLTRLLNRSALMHDLTRLNAGRKSYALIILDVDNFRAVNDHYGHEGGDQVLRDVGAVLNDLTQAEGLRAYRLSGNEFAVVYRGERHDAEQAAESCRRAVGHATQSHCRQLGLTVSGGYFWVSGAEPVNALTVVQNAVEALGVAKGDRDALQPFTAEVASGQRRRKAIEQRLEGAIETGELTFAFQPIVCIESGEIVGAETLARWTDPQMGPVGPLEFVPIAERTGLVHELGWAGIRASCDLARYFMDNRIDAYVTVNVSPVQLRSPMFFEEFLRTVSSYEVGTSALKIEVTENVFIDEDDPAVAAVRAFSRAGFQIALDDFGNGYSSLGYMSKIPYNIVKLDRSITQSLSHPTLKAIVQALVQTAQNKSLSIIPEGIENQETAAHLQSLGVEVGQGWFWSKALPFADFVDLLKSQGCAATALKKSDVGVSSS